MTSLENNGQDMDLTELEVMEPKMMIHDELKVIYINEALEEALNDEIRMKRRNMMPRKRHIRIM